MSLHAVCRWCGRYHEDTECVNAVMRERDKARVERDQAEAALKAHREFVTKLADFMDVQAGRSKHTVDRHQELFQHILKLREELLEIPGYYEFGQKP